MRVFKWRNGLAIRLPAEVIDALELKERDEVEIRVANRRAFEVSRKQGGEPALVQLRKLRRQLPDGFKFDRNDANRR
jgi:antitoxin MazE